MPLAGYVCCRDGKPHPFDDCIQANREGLCQHSLPLLNAMKMNADRRSGIGISSSVLNVCPRQHILAERNDYYEDPKDFYSRWRGSFGHFAIEMGGPYPGVVQEVRFYRTIDVDGVPFTISGQPDWVDVSRHHISDAKFVGYAPKNGPYQDHENQVNVYAWLVEGGYVRYTKNEFVSPLSIELREYEAEAYPGSLSNPIPEGWEVESASINYMDTKGEHIYPLTLWTNEARERFITQRLMPHKVYAETGSLAGIGITNEEDAWKGKYCPFARPENPGRCCMQDAEHIFFKATWIIAEVA